MAKTVTAPLTGKALLQKLKTNNLTKRELAKDSGYYSVTKGGRTRVNLAEFYDVVLAAKGVALEPESSKQDGRGRETTYRVSVHKNGQIVVGSAYTEEMGSWFCRSRGKGDEFNRGQGIRGKVAHSSSGLIPAARNCSANRSGRCCSCSGRCCSCSARCCSCLAISSGNKTNLSW